MRLHRRLALVAVAAVAVSGLAATLAANGLRAPDPGTAVIRHIPRVAVFMGDSYTEAIPHAAIEKRSSGLIARAHGWTEINLAHGGTGYLPANPPIGNSYTEMIDEAAAADPDVVVVNGGRNELDRANADWAAGVAAFYVSLRAAVGPDAQIIATSPIWSAEPPPMTLLAMCTVVQRAVTAVGGTYVDLGDPLLGRPDLLAADSIHPNDAGHAAIARAFAAAYTRTG